MLYDWVMQRSFTIPGPWLTLNEYISAERSNKFKAAAMKRNETERMMRFLRGEPITSKIDVTFQSFVANRKKDPDNLYAMFLKCFFDALVKKGILENDGQKQIGRIVLEQPRLDGKERMEVSLF